MNGIFRVPKPINEPVLGYNPGSPEKAELKAKLAELRNKVLDIPLVIGGKEIRTGNSGDCRCPHNHDHLLGRYSKGNATHVKMAVEAARKAYSTWSKMPWEARASIFLKAADLLAGPWRATLNAATMLAQSKTAHQAEIDAACELIDFYRFNPHYVEQIYGEQPGSSPGCWNYLEHRPLEGFVFAITPFNFTSIAGNLPVAPAMMGNVVLWKPASSAVYTAHFLMRLLQEAGLPDGVINLLPGSGGEIGTPVLSDPNLAGVHFTGSTAVFQGMWKLIGSNIDKYKYYPRIVGETGGKDFVFAHRSADPDELACALIRGAFEYQGQKCSAASRAYIPTSLWPELKKRLISETAKIKMGDPEDFTNFMAAVIDKAAFDSITGYIDYAKSSDAAEFITGGGYSADKGYFIEPTIIRADDPKFKLMVEEIFGPVLTIYVYDDEKLEETLELCDSATMYALTGAVFAKERDAVVRIADALRNSAGNFYINDKPTGAVVGQQPFGGGRASGTNDKAGSVLNLLRWVSPRTIKETFVPPKDFRYPFLEEK